MGQRSTAFFMARPRGQRFCVYHPPSDDSRPVVATLVHVHAFGEEMNKSRRMIALQCQHFVAAQCAVLQIDLSGCGDSSGEFDEATWDEWIDDIVAAHAWLRSHHPSAPVWLWGLRLGALLAGIAAQRLPTPISLLWWQPVLSGKLQLQQFLRLKAASVMAEGGDAKAVMARLRSSLEAGAPVEIGGYILMPALANALGVAEMPAPGRDMRVRWIELSQRDDSSISPLAAQQAAAWQAQGLDLRCHSVSGPTFWQTIEIETAPALLGRSVEVVQA